MEQFIWYSISGVFWLVILFFVHPSFRQNNFNIALMPVVGFIMHQLFRFIFEMSGGFARPSRRSLKYLWNEIVKSTEDVDYQKSFLIWETTFYGQTFPEAFRQHNRRTWHFIIALWSGELNSFFASIVLVGFNFKLIREFIGLSDLNLIAMNKIILFFIIIGLIFHLSAKWTYERLMKQEVAVIENKRQCFEKTRMNLIYLDKKLTKVFGENRPVIK